MIAAALLLAATPLATSHADPPDILAGIAVQPQHHRYDYRRAAFGEAWDSGGPCDTRDEILDRDMTDKTYVSVKRCPTAVASGTLHDPYTGKIIMFQRGPRSSEAVQIDHIVSAAPMKDAAIHTVHSVDDMPLSDTAQLADSYMSGERTAHLDIP